MNTIIETFISNKEWLFSGIGVAIFSFIIAFLFKKKTRPQSYNAPSQNNKISGDANIYQAGGDIKIEKTSNPMIRGNPDIRIVSVDVIDDIKEISNFRKRWLDKNRERGLGVFPILDIKLWNKGDGPGFLSHVELKVERQNFVLDPVSYSALPSSWEYTVLIDSHLDVDDKEILISQYIPSNDVDRFVMIIGHEMNYGEFKYVDYIVEPIIHYNEGEQLSLGKFPVRIHSPVNFDKSRLVKTRKMKVEDLTSNESLEKDAP